MNNLLYKYMNERFNNIKPDDNNKKSGPVITISRAAGCSLSQIIVDLSTKLNKNNQGTPWEVINKEILHHSANILKMSPEKLNAVFQQKNRSMFDEIVQAFISSDYQIERKMVKTIINVIHQFGLDGYKIIVGRGSNIICSDIHDALHIRIEAPLNWRIDWVQRNKKMSREDAVNYIEQTDKNRENFQKLIIGDREHKNNYDLIINQSAFTQHEISDIIISAMRIKKFI